MTRRHAGQKNGMETLVDKQPKQNQTPTLSPTYAIRFTVLAAALRSLRLHDYNPAPGIDIVKSAKTVTGLKTRDLQKLEDGVRWLYAQLTTVGVIVCPQCGKPAVLPCVPEFAAKQKDGTTHVCHLFIGGCDMGFAIDPNDAQVKGSDNEPVTCDGEVLGTVGELRAQFRALNINKKGG